MNKVFIISVLILTMGSCLLLADPNAERDQRELLTDKAQKTIITSIENTLRTNFFYESFYFSRLVQHKPKEIRELENLFVEKEELPNNRKKYNSRDEYNKKFLEIDSLIDVKRNYIKENNIRSNYSMDHIFSLVDKEGEERIMDATYYMNSTLDSIIRIKVNMNAEIPLQLKGMFDVFFFEDPLNRSDNYNDDVRADEAFYSFYKTRLAEIEDVEEKSNFAVHAILITHLTRRNQKYLPQQFGLFIAVELIKNSFEDRFKKGLRSSQFNAIMNEKEDVILGYEVFIEVEFTDEDNPKKCFYINFNPWLEITNFEFVDPPYEEFLN